MPYSLFPHLNPTKLEPFKKSYEDRMRIEEEINNARQWKMGIYMRSALASAWNSENKYFEKPIEWNKEDEKPEEEYTEEEIMKARENFIMGLKAMQNRFEEHKEQKGNET